MLLKRLAYSHFANTQNIHAQPKNVMLMPRCHEKSVRKSSNTSAEEARFNFTGCWAKNGGFNATQLNICCKKRKKLFACKMHFPLLLARF